MQAYTRPPVTLAVLVLSPLLCSTGPAVAQEEQVEVTCRAFMDAVFEGAIDEAGAFIDERGFVFAASFAGEVRLYDAEAFVQFLEEEPPPGGVALENAEVSVYGGVALLTADLVMPETVADATKVFVVVSADAGEWKINILAVTLADREYADDEVAPLAEIIGEMSDAGNVGDMDTALARLGEEPFVGVASDPVGGVHAFDNRDELIALITTMTPKDATFQPVITDSVAVPGLGCALVDVTIELPGLGFSLTMRGLLVIAKVEGEWVIPAAGAGPVME